MTSLQKIPMKYRAPDLGFAKGWYYVADSDQVTSDAMLPVSYLDQQLIVYRDAQGEAHVTDAYCPHLGAHLASHDGCLTDGRIVCPFHKWAFDATSGQCVSIPYADVIPVRAKLKMHPTREIDSAVLMWYHPEGLEPDFEPLHADQLNLQGTWLVFMTKVRESTSPYRDPFENLFDTAHIQQLHRANGLPVIQTIERKPYGLFVEFTPPTGPEDFEITRQDVFISGVSMVTLVVEGPGYGFMANSWLTPIDRERTSHVTRMRLRDSGSAEMNQVLGNAFAERTSMEIDQDMNVLNFKKHLAQPILCGGDGPIVRWRRYQDEFYIQSAARAQA